MLTCHSSDDAFLIPVVLYSLYWWNWQGIFLLFNIKLNSFEEFYPLLIWDQTRDTFCTRCGILSSVSCLRVYLRRESFLIRNKASLTLPWFSLAFRLPVASSKYVFWNLTLTSSLRVSASWNIKWWLSGSGKTKGDRRKWSKGSKTGEAIHQDDWFHIPLLKGAPNHCCNSKVIFSKLGNTSAPDIPHRFLFYGANLRLAETTSEQVPVIQILKQRDKKKQYGINWAVIKYTSAFLSRKSISKTFLQVPHIQPPGGPLPIRQGCQTFIPQVMRMK